MVFVSKPPFTYVFYYFAIEEIHKSECSGCLESAGNVQNKLEGRKYYAAICITSV